MGAQKTASGPESGSPATPASKPDRGGSGGSGGGLKGKVVFTPVYGCDEGATGVGPVCSILEVRL